VPGVKQVIGYEPGHLLDERQEGSPRVRGHLDGGSEPYSVPAHYCMHTPL